MHICTYIVTCTVYTYNHQAWDTIPNTVHCISTQGGGKHSWCGRPNCSVQICDRTSLVWKTLSAAGHLLTLFVVCGVSVRWQRGSSIPDCDRACPVSHCHSQRQLPVASRPDQRCTTAQNCWHRRPQTCWVCLSEEHPVRSRRVGPVSRAR